MRKMKNSKGFTLMEMLIVVAIIAILVAIMIPTLTTQLERARETADLANIRAAYAEASVTALTEDKAGTATVTMTQHTDGFKYVTAPDYLTKNGDTAATGWSDVTSAVSGATVTVTVNPDGTVAYAAQAKTGD